MPMPRFSLRTLLILPAILIAINWLVISYSATTPTVPRQFMKTETGIWFLAEPDELAGIPIRSIGWPFAYQWAPSPEENLSLPLTYRSHGIKYLPLFLNMSIATAFSILLTWAPAVWLNPSMKHQQNETDQN